jgi:hypothetical protein
MKDISLSRVEKNLSYLLCLERGLYPNELDIPLSPSYYAMTTIYMLVSIVCI